VVKLTSKKGFTLIELIFAIVVISISVISLPMMNQVNSKGLDSNLVQEAIFGATAELSGALTPHWDENSTVDDQNSLARVIDIDNKCNEDGREHRLKGHINQPLHRRCLNDSGVDPADKNDSDEIFALEDMEHTAQDLFDGESSANGYKKNYKSEVTLRRSVDFNGVNDHIKEINITIKDSDGNIITLLQAYSANIGEVDYYKRTY
jgi:prepilin-type N-terminal cleavage/methylation domain-containing protein